MADRFVVLDRPSANLKGSWRRAYGAGARTRGTGLVIAEKFPLGFQRLLNSPLENGSADIDSEGFDGIEVDIESRPFVPICTTGDNFSPPVCHVAQVRQILGLTFGERHRVFVLELGEKGKVENSA